MTKKELELKFADFYYDKCGQPNLLDKEDLWNWIEDNCIQNTDIKTVPYQYCPICNGIGQVLADGCTANIFQPCKVCKGAMIIPQYIISK